MTRPELERKLAALARQPAVVRGGEAAAEPADVELAMADLISDDNGEIVFFNDSGFHSLSLRTDASVVANGRTQAHVTAAGDDVSGFNYVRFENGLTLFYEERLQLIVLGGIPPAST